MGAVAPSVCSPRGSPVLPSPLPALAPPPTAIAAGGSSEVGQLAPRTVGLREQTTSAMAAGRAALLASLVEGGDAEE
jgi:hypothetical protein